MAPAGRNIKFEDENDSRTSFGNDGDQASEELRDETIGAINVGQQSHSYDSTVSKNPPSQSNSSVRRRRFTPNAEEDSKRGVSEGESSMTIQSQPDGAHIELGPALSTNKDRAGQLRNLEGRLQQVRQRQSEHVQNIQRLESQIEEGEVKCGRMIEQWLTLGRAIEIKKMHVREDKAKLSEEQKLRDRAFEETSLLTTQFSSLALEMSNDRASNNASSS